MTVHRRLGELERRAGAPGEPLTENERIALVVDLFVCGMVEVAPDGSYRATRADRRLARLVDLLELARQRKARARADAQAN